MRRELLTACIRRARRRAATIVRLCALDSVEAASLAKGVARAHLVHRQQVVR